MVEPERKIRVIVLEELYNESNYIRGLLGKYYKFIRRKDYDDIEQQVYYYVLKRGHEIINSSVIFYCVKSAVNNWRKFNTKKVPVEDVLQKSPMYHDKVRESAVEEIKKYLPLLSDSRRMILELHLQGNTDPEIAEILGKNVSTVYNTRKAAIARLKGILDGTKKPPPDINI